jgi:hypothetical protein
VIANWDVLLAEWAAAQVGRPFVWGETDCVSLTCAGLAVVLGRPFFPKPAYSSEAAAKQLVPFGGRLGQQLALLGRRVPELMAQSADVVVIPADETAGEFCDGLGLIVGTTQVIVANPEHGVRSLKLEAVRRVAPVEVYRVVDA